MSPARNEKPLPGEGVPLTSVSVVIPTWNSMTGGKSVERTISSVVSQGVDVEVIVVDNFSRDSTEAVCLRQGARVMRKAGSRSEARNFGLEIATGDFVLFLDSDHELEPGALAEAIGLAMAKDLDAVFLKTTYLQIDSDNRVSSSPLELELRLRDGVRFPNLFRRSSVSGRRFRPSLELGEDHAFMQGIVGHGAKVGTMSWGLRHYSRAGLAPVWERSVQYGRAYRRNHDLPDQVGFFSSLGVWNVAAVRAYYAMLRSFPRDAITLTQFLLVKYLGFAFGLLAPGRKATRDEEH